jgi:hypothetical protein
MDGMGGRRDPTRFWKDRILLEDPPTPPRVVGRAALNSVPLDTPIPKMLNAENTSLYDIAKWVVDARRNGQSGSIQGPKIRGSAGG